MKMDQLFFGAGYDCTLISETSGALMKKAGMNTVRIGRTGGLDLQTICGQLQQAQENGFLAIVQLHGDDFLQVMEQCADFDCVAGYSMGNICAPLESQIRSHMKPGQFLCCESSLQMERGSAADLIGCTIRTPVGLQDTGLELSFGDTLARCMKQQGFLVLNAMSQGRIGHQPYPGQMRLQAFHHVSNGAVGVLFDRFQSDAYQKGILGWDQIPGGAYQECASIGNDFFRLRDSLLGLEKRSRVAILVSQKSDFGLHNVLGADYMEYLRWIYGGFYRMNVEVDLVGDCARDFSDYDLLVVPCLYCADAELTQAIRKFVRRGGHLLATFHSFFADENQKIHEGMQPYGMTDVFGMHYADFTAPENTRLSNLPGEVEDWMELLQPDTARVLSWYDNPGWRDSAAVTINRFGRGSAAYLGCCIRQGLEPLLRQLLSMWHIPVPEISWPVVIHRAMDQNGNSLIFLLHYSPDVAVIPSPATGMELRYRCPIKEGEPLTMFPWDVKILEVQK